MRIIICSNIGNGIGLQKDYELLKAFLVAEGHEVAGQQYDQPAAVAPGDLLIWLEVISEHLLHLAPRSWLISNPEWLKPEYIRPIQRHCEKVFAKTHDAERELRSKFQNVSYVGFLTEDKRLKSFQPKERKFLHIGGNGGFRNTNAVISAWREYRYWDGEDIGAELTVVSNSKTVVPFEDTPGVTFIKRATDEELKELQNSHLFHLYPSAYEGFGHAVHEAQSVGAVALTTDAPPMNELDAPYLVPSIGKKRNNLGMLHEVSPADIRETVTQMLQAPDWLLSRLSLEARKRFEAGNEEFKTLFRPHLNASTERPEPVLASPAVQTRVSKPKIAILGNLEPEHSTESDLLWTLRDMGYPVTTFQENRDRTEEIAKFDGALLIYVHTHGWQTPGTIGLDETIATLRRRNVKTASFHLDRYVGLNISDGRESRVGSHPFWRTDTVFTADGGNQEFFAARGINHIWLPPGVVKRDCWLGQEQKDLVCDVGFVGATGYHPEYPFRGQLIEFLRSVYGERFRVFQGYRGARLNNLYASIRVVVGDSCFGGSDYYWSDRVSETTGRGGFLVHPATKGLTIPGLVTFTPGDLSDLQDRIDYYLDRPVERIGLQHAAHAWVRDNETYHNRMEKLLGMMGC